MMDENLVVDLNVKVYNHGSWFTVKIFNNGTGESWSKQMVALSAIEAADIALRSLNVTSHKRFDVGRVE